ncbi:MAG: MaoC family dehydratase [Gemmatimonadetes bacterium]|nr:MaoC family dehydratase [Gemmatimonadota bacterium]
MTLPSALEVEASFGAPPLVSPWLQVTQDLMNEFGAATLDPDWMHVDPERAARDGPFDGTIAFGFWTLSLLTHFLREVVGQDYPPGVRYGFNYGLDRVRFVRPIPVGSRIRNRMEITEVRPKSEGRFLVRTRNEVEIEGEAKPAMVAEWLLLLVY